MSDPILGGADLAPEWIAHQDDADALALAWDRCRDGSVLMRVAAVAEEDRRPVLRAAIACARLASHYELATHDPYFPIVDALEEIDRYIEAPDRSNLALLAKYSQEVASWVKWTAGSTCSHAIADAVQLTHAIARRSFRVVPRLAGDVVRNAADSMVEDVLRADGAPDDDRAVEAVLRARALAFLTEIVRQLVPRPSVSVNEVLARARTLRDG